jgi:hypothetical protein
MEFRIFTRVSGILRDWYEGLGKNWTWIWSLKSRPLKIQNSSEEWKAIRYIYFHIFQPFKNRPHAYIRFSPHLQDLQNSSFYFKLISTLFYSKLLKIGAAAFMLGACVLWSSVPTSRQTCQSGCNRARIRCRNMTAVIVWTVSPLTYTSKQQLYLSFWLVPWWR